MKNLYGFRIQWFYLWLLVGLLAGETAVAQAIPNTQWSRESAGPFTIATDGSIVTAYTNSNGAVVVRYSPSNNQIGPTTNLLGLVSPGLLPQKVDLIGSTPDGGAVVVASRFSGSEMAPFLTKVNSAGVQVWKKPIELSPINSGDQLIFEDLISMPDGKILLMVTNATTSSKTSVFVLTYDSNGNPLLTSEARTGTGKEVYKGEALLNAPGGGYVIFGYYNNSGSGYTNDPLSESGPAMGWVLKVNPDGSRGWEKYLQNLPIPGSPGSQITTRLITDATLSIDNNGYVLAAAGYNFSAQVQASVQTVALELGLDGSLKKVGLLNTLPTPAFITPYTGGDGKRFYIVANTSLESGADPRLIKIEPTQLQATTSRVFDYTQLQTYLNNVAVAGDGGIVFSGSTIGVVKLLAEAPSSTGLVIGIPTYDCNTGQLTVSTSGGNGSFIEYQIVGLRAWSGNSVFSVPTYQRQGTTFTIQVRQSGQVKSLQFTTDCFSVPSGQFVLRLPSFNCQTGELELFYSNADGPVEYRVAGLRDWGASSKFTVPSFQRNGTTFTLEARTASGKSDKLFFTTSCNTTPPPSNLPLGFGVPELNCSTGQLMVTVTGTGDNTAIQFKIPGLRDWGNSMFTVPTYQRNGTTFTLYARQSGVEYTSQYTTACPVSTRLATAETGRGIEVLLHSNPVADQLKAEIRGAAQQTVQLQLTNPSGQIVQSRRVEILTNQHQEVFNVPTLSTGLYVLRVAGQHQTVTVKVLKQ